MLMILYDLKSSHEKRHGRSEALEVWDFGTLGEAFAPSHSALKRMHKDRRYIGGRNDYMPYV